MSDLVSLERRVEALEASMAEKEVLIGKLVAMVKLTPSGRIYTKALGL